MLKAITWSSGIITFAMPVYWLVMALGFVRPPATANVPLQVAVWIFFAVVAIMCWAVEESEKGAKW